MDQPKRGACGLLDPVQRLRSVEALPTVTTGRMIRILLDGLYLIAGYLAGLFLIAIFLLMLALSFGREVGINVPAGDDFAAWCMAAMAFLGLAYTFKTGEIIRVGLVLDRLRGRARWAVELVCLAIGSVL